MAETSIEWSEHVWNPIVGCSVVSPGCTNCYAMRMAARLERMGQDRYIGLTKPSKAGAIWTGETRLADEALMIPLRRRKPTTYFVNSMSDLFHESAPDAWIDRVFAVMALCPQHTFQVLTKRSARMRAYLTPERRHAVAAAAAAIADGTPDLFKARAAIRASGVPIGKAPDPLAGRWPLPNVWLGVSAEDQRRADERAADLAATPAAVRWVSVEPMLGPVDFEAMPFTSGDPRHRWSALTGQAIMYADGEGVGPDFRCRMTNPIKPRLDWIVVGGESGPGARKFHTAWAQSIVNQCASAGVPVFVKQLGDKPVHTATMTPGGPPITLPLRASRKGKDMAEWPVSLRVRQMPFSLALERSHAR